MPDPLGELCGKFVFTMVLKGYFGSDKSAQTVYRLPTLCGRATTVNKKKPWHNVCFAKIKSANNFSLISIISLLRAFILEIGIPGVKTKACLALSVTGEWGHTGWVKGLCSKGKRRAAVTLSLERQSLGSSQLVFEIS